MFKTITIVFMYRQNYVHKAALQLSLLSVCLRMHDVHMLCSGHC